ncbi:hypothetical protein BBK36DRAFT_1169995 [Trichoderma citrinoviride]|uniref:Uncharacterized protein n=1 Tax=Trichoderma citrinoviride TaxID=58853 RepID=A0A2T4B7P2_9HYPO|nr:hypothetical protein BBK36DRAFT_1169995 [Trichoderma citrinoviride]PTB65249.1 hypothetical protein BBK36DRAFT_1169995 [Trichoderma citrinoviride]
MGRNKARNRGKDRSQSDMSQAEPGLKQCSTGSAQEAEKPYLRCAAEWIDGVQCPTAANMKIVCQKCQLVAYCSQDCKQEHAKVHKASCPPPHVPPSAGIDGAAIPDHPVFDTGVFWGNYAATDILNLAENEGAEYNGPLKLLLLGPFALRHLVYSVAAMPETALPDLEVVICENDLPQLLRTIISLHAMIWYHDDPSRAAEVVSQVWYSLKLPQEIYSYIRETFSETVSNARKEVRSFREGGNIQTAGVAFKGSNLRLHTQLEPDVWDAIVDHIHQTPSKNAATARLARETDAALYGEPLDRVHARMSPSRAAALMKWRQDGILMPYSSPTESFVKQNPIFFNPDGSQPTGLTNEPLSEWPMKEILEYAPYPARGDVYGKMSCYIRSKVVAFLKRVEQRKINISLTACGLTEMVGQLREFYERRLPSFDRIEVGHLFEFEPELCFLSCATLLRHADENPLATMLTMCRESVVSAESPKLDKYVAAEKDLIFHRNLEPLDAIIPPAQAAGENYSAASLRRHMGILLFRDWDMFSYHYLNDADRFGGRVPGEELSHQPKASILKTGYMGVHLKRRNTIVNAWPNRLVHGAGSRPSKEEVSRWVSWSTTKPERWLEWKRTGDVNTKEWLRHLGKIRGPYVLANMKKLYNMLLAADQERDYHEEDEEEGGDEAIRVMVKNVEMQGEQPDQEENDVGLGLIDWEYSENGDRAPGEAAKVE